VLRIHDNVKFERQAAWRPVFVKLEHTVIGVEIVPGEDRSRHARGIGRRHEMFRGSPPVRSPCRGRSQRTRLTPGGRVYRSGSPRCYDEKYDGPARAPMTARNNRNPKLNLRLTMAAMQKLRAAAAAAHRSIQ
jgi:hypothetical protein